VRDDAEAAVLVAPLDDGDPGPDGIAPARQAERERDVVVRAEFDLDRSGLDGAVDQHRQHADPARPDDDVDVRRASPETRALLLRDAAGHRHHRVPPGLGRQDAQLAKPRVELVLRVLADAARVDHHDIGVPLVLGALVAGRLEQTGHLLRVVEVHLAAVGFDQVLPAHARSFAFRLSLSPFAFAPAARTDTGVLP